MGKYLQLLDRAAQERGRDKSDKSDKSPSPLDRTDDFGRLCRFSRSPDPACAAPWGDAQEERAAIVEYDGGALRAWAEGFTRLDPNNPPGAVPLRRWLRTLRRKKPNCSG